MKITRKQLRQIIKEEVKRVKAKKRSMEPTETPQARRPWNVHVGTGKPLPADWVESYEKLKDEISQLPGFTDRDEAAQFLSDVQALGFDSAAEDWEPVMLLGRQGWQQIFRALRDRGYLNQFGGWKRPDVVDDPDDDSDDVAELQDIIDDISESTKITRRQLRRIVKEEVKRVTALKEEWFPGKPVPPAMLVGIYDANSDDGSSYPVEFYDKHGFDLYDDSQQVDYETGWNMVDDPEMEGWTEDDIPEAPSPQEYKRIINSAIKAAKHRKAKELGLDNGVDSDSDGALDADELRSIADDLEG